MIPIVIIWTNYTATVDGRVAKLVSCENCQIEYVYTLEREAVGGGTSLYYLDEDGAQERAGSNAAEALREYLANDFDPVPCPACGHYQRFMFPKLYSTKSGWSVAATVLLLAIGGVAAISALMGTIGYLDRPKDGDLLRLGIAWVVMIVCGLIGAALASAERARVRHFDPNVGDPSARIAMGRSRAVMRAEFEAARQEEEPTPAPPPVSDDSRPWKRRSNPAPG